MGHMDGLDMLDPITSSSMTTLTPMSENPSHMHSYGMNHVMNHHHHGGPLSGHGAPGHHPGHHGGHPGAHHPAMAAAAAAAAVAGLHPDADTDPRELEAFAERFKQRRIKLGVTQADVGMSVVNRFRKFAGIQSVYFHSVHCATFCCITYLFSESLVYARNIRQLSKKNTNRTFFLSLKIITFEPTN